MASALVLAMHEWWEGLVKDCVRNTMTLCNEVHSQRKIAIQEAKQKQAEENMRAGKRKRVHIPDPKPHPKIISQRVQQMNARTSDRDINFTQFYCGFENLNLIPANEMMGP